MRKLKKFAAALLSAAMVLTTMAVPAMATAEGPDTILQSEGTLIINKYEGTDTTNPMGGVTFNVYKIANITQTVDQNNGSIQLDAESVVNEISTEELNELARKNTSAEEWAELAKKISYDSFVNDKIAVATGTTADETNVETGTVKGQVQFTLPVGIYAVVEADAPSQVITKSANFIVSIPMTSDNGENWNYDIVANPKNTTAYGGINVHKTGVTHDVMAGTVADTTVDLAGVEFTLQEKVDEVWTTIKSANTDSQGTLNISDLKPGEYRLVETSLGEITTDSDNNVTSGNAGYILDSKTLYEFVLTLVDGETHVFVDGKDEGTSFTFDIVNEKPDLEKTVKKSDGNYGNDTDVSVGDTVSWRVVASVPEKIEELKTYKLTDKMSSGLTWVSEEAAKLTVSSNGETLTKNSDYNLTCPGDNEEGGQWIIAFTEAGKTKLKTSVIITFDTLLNDSANIGQAGNLNDAKLDYSNAIYSEDTDVPNGGKEPKEDEIKDQAIVYTFQTEILKIDGTTQTPLNDVEFDLYRLDDTTVTDVTETVLTDSSKATKIGSYITKDGGKISVTGLMKAKYYLVETKTKDGYNLLKAPVQVNIAADYATEKHTVTKYDSTGKIVSVETTVNTTTFEGSDATGKYSVTVKNNKGFNLPTTGGMGTIIFTVGGIALALAGVMIILASRKKTA